MGFKNLKDGIKDYFNEQSSWSRYKATYALIGTTAIALSGSDLTMYFLVPALLYTAGKINLWQEAAKGEPFWKPRLSNTIGL